MTEQRYPTVEFHPGGSISGPEFRIHLDPQECLLRREGEWVVCVRSDHRHSHQCWSEDGKP